MKIKCFKRVLSIALATMFVLTACGQEPAANTSETEKTSESTVTKETEAVSETEKTVNKEDLPIITLYPKDANLFSGLVTGFRSDFFAENGGFQLEVWAYSDAKTTGILTSGDLPDIMYVQANSDTFQTLVETDKIINYDDYQEYLPNYFSEDAPNEYNPQNIQKIRDEFSCGTGGVYALPTGVGVKNKIYEQVGTFDRRVVKLKWDVYEAIGAPEITDMWQLIDVVEEMLAYQPTLEDGTKMYGTFLDNGLDSAQWGGMALWYYWHGCDYSTNQYMVTKNMVDGTLSPLLADDGLYKEGVKWYNELYRRGLMDPDSISTARTDQAPKIDNGLAMLPSGTLPGWATKYYEVFVPGLPVYYDFTTELYNGGWTYVVNKETEHLEECLAFINMLADPYCWLNINYGPEGVIWETEGNVMSITDEFAAWLEENGSINFFPMGDGTEWSTWNTQNSIGTGTAIPGYVDVNGNDLCCVPTSWPDAQAITTDNENWLAWKETMGAEDLWDYVEKNGVEVYTSSPWDGVAVPKADDSMALTIASIKDVVVPATWQMVYAESDEELEELWDQMVEDANALGAQEVMEWFMENYKPAN